MATISVCTAQDIIELNKTKEYLITASCLLQEVTTDPNLNAQASMLWQILFNKAKFNEKLETQISCSYLAQMLGKSIRTIQRHIKALSDNNYIVIINNYLNSGGQTINTIQVRFPADKIQEAKQTKDRMQSNLAHEITFEKESEIEQTENNIPKPNSITEKTPISPSILGSIRFANSLIIRAKPVISSMDSPFILKAVRNAPN